MVGGGDGYGWEELEGEVKVIDEKLLNEVIAQAKKSPRLRMRSACRFACQRIKIFIRVWMRSVMAGFAFLCRDSA